MNKIYVICFAVLLLVSCASIQDPGKSRTELTNREKAVALLNSLETGDPEPVGHINPDKYIQHNLMVKDGLAGFGELMQHIPKGSIKVNVLRAFSDGMYVFTHTEYDFFGPKAGFDIFRFENGKIAEHWDVIETILPENKRQNTNGKFGFK